MEYVFIIFALAMSFSQAVFAADDSDSELLRVKEALVEAAMEKGVSVVSNAYIDGNGELIESAFYRSGATLRGIRMPQYFTDEPYDARMLFSDTAFNASLSCQELSPHKYRKAISIDTTSVILENNPDQQFEAIIASLRSEITMSATSAIAENLNYYVIPISYERNMISSRYEAALQPRSNSADPKNTNFVIKAEITNLRPVNYSPVRIYDQGLVQAQRVGKFVANGFKNILTAYPERAASSAPSFDFDLEVSFLRVDGLRENAEKVINKKVVELRFDRGFQRSCIRIAPQVAGFCSKNRPPPSVGRFLCEHGPSECMKIDDKVTATLKWGRFQSNPVSIPTT